MQRGLYTFYIYSDVGLPSLCACILRRPSPGPLAILPPADIASSTTYPLNRRVQKPDSKTRQIHKREDIRISESLDFFLFFSWIRLPALLT